jgi:hypothetical protein
MPLKRMLDEASTKRTSHWPAPVSWEAPVRFRVILAVAAFALAG